jgi:hypothetical protein
VQSEIAMRRALVEAQRVQQGHDGGEPSKPSVTIGQRARAHALAHLSRIER